MNSYVPRHAKTIRNDTEPGRRARAYVGRHVSVVSFWDTYAAEMARDAHAGRWIA